MIEKHVTSLELSKRLKDLGVLQGAMYHWQPNGVLIQYLAFQPSDPKQDGYCAAFLASELGEMLPYYITPSIPEDEGKENAGWFDVFKNDKGTWAAKITYRQIAWDESLPNALAKLLIHLIEQGIVDHKTL